MGVINNIRAVELLQGASDMPALIREAVDNLHKKINLYKYYLVVMPEYRNRDNQYMMRYIYRFNQPRLRSVEEILSAEAEEELAMICKQNVLVVDDSATGKSRLNEVLHSLRMLNKDNEITVFSIAWKH